MAEFTDQQIAEELDKILEIARSDGWSEAQTTKFITDAAVKHNISLQRIADVTVYNEADIQNAVDRATAQGAEIIIPGDLGLTPTNGLEGVETALNEGVINARNSINSSSNAAQNRVRETSGQAAAELSPFKETGLQANEQLAALNGLLGPDAQAQAFADFKSSSGQQFLLEQANNNLLGNSTATGGLGGGDVKRELQRQAIGLASQDFGNHINRLETTRNGGQAAASGTAQLLGNQGFAEADILRNRGTQLADLDISAAGNKAAARLSTSQLLGDQAFQAGLQEAGFNQQNRMAGVNAIGAGGSDISTIIQNAARSNGSLNLSQADIDLALSQLGIKTIPYLETGRSGVLADSFLAGANKDGELLKTAYNNYNETGNLLGAV